MTTLAKDPNHAIIECPNNHFTVRAIHPGGEPLTSICGTCRDQCIMNPPEIITAKALSKCCSSGMEEMGRPDFAGNDDVSMLRTVCERCHKPCDPSLTN